MADTSYEYSDTTVTPQSIDRLEYEITQSEILISLRSINLTGISLVITFKSALSSDEETSLTTIVSNHSGEPLPDQPIIVDVLGPKDSEGSLLNRTKLTKTGWHYEPRIITFRTATHKSLHNRKHNAFKLHMGTDWGDATLKFYDENGNQLLQSYSEDDAPFQARLNETCTCTILSWQPHYDMEMVSGGIRVTENIGKEAMGWFVFAPDIPEVYGGNVPFMTGGLNLGMLAEYEYTPFDGRTPKFMAYDPIYNTNKAIAKIVHGLGVNIKVQLRFEHFRG